MNEMIDLRDSKVLALSWADGAAIILFRPVHVHRSEGRPGVDAGTVWLQEVMLTVTDALISAHGKLPAIVNDGSLSIGAEVHKNLIPAAGVFAGEITLELTLNGTEHLKLKCDQLMITLTGEAEYLEKFEP
jgi:hypothetical protein